VLVLGFASAVAGELWDASHPPYPPQQSSTTYNLHKSNPAAESERPEEAIARYNLGLMIFTGVLAIATIGLGAISISQLRLARAEFAATHRPRIRIKHVWLVALGSDKPVTVEIVYANVGDAKAVVSRIGMDFNVINPDTPLPGNMTAPERPYVKYPECGLGVTVGTGNVTSLGSLDEWRVAAIRDGKKLLCCFGFIEYSDVGPKETRKIRRTAFCRIYKPSANPIDGMGRFVRPDKPDPDYEYED
jgi:hypothetical protein